MTVDADAHAAKVLSLIPFRTRADAILAAPDAVYVVRGTPPEGLANARALHSPALPPAPTSARELRILHINDLHGQVTRPTRYDGEKPVLSRIAWYLAQEDYRPTLFLSAGDELSGSILDGLLDGPEPCHVPYRLYSRLGLSAAAVGNHDLDGGQAALAHVANRASFPLLAANLTGSEHLNKVVSPAAIFVIGGLRVGIVGLITSAQLRQRPGEDWRVSDPATALLHLLPALRPLVDIVIVLSHLGHALGSEGATVAPLGDVELARRIPRGAVHLIVGGHTHHALNAEGLMPSNVINGIPIVQAGARGQALGEVCLTWRPGREGGQAAVDEARLIPISDLRTDECFEATEVQPLIRQAQPQLARVIGQIAPIDGLTTSDLRREIDTGESLLANFVTGAMVKGCRANGLAVDLAMIDASILRLGLQPGVPLTVEDWFRVMPFADAVRLYRISGRQLIDLLADNALRLRRPGEPRTERGFVHLSSELRYAIALGPTRANASILRATFRGEDLSALPFRLFTIVSHSHFRESAQAWERTVSTFGGQLIRLAEWSREDTDLSLRDEIIAYCEAVGGVTAEAGAIHDGRVHVLQDDIPYEHHLFLHQPALP